jgi:hypothetical protein
MAALVEVQQDAAALRARLAHREGELDGLREAMRRADVYRPRMMGHRVEP